MEKFTDIKLNEVLITKQRLTDIVNTNSQLDTSDVALNTVTKSEPVKFISKLFESRQMSHIYHLQVTGEGAYAEHVALDMYYNKISELVDYLIEVYQGQYDIIEGYEVIDSQPKEENSIGYFIALADFIKNTRYVAFLKEDTHLHNIIDEMVSIIYRTLYKLKNLK